METEIRVTRGETMIEFDSPQVDQMTEIFDYFADRVLTDGDIGPDGMHGVVDMQAIEAIYDAAESGRTVSLE